MQIEHNQTLYKIAPNKVVDLSIPYNFNGQQPNFYNVNKGSSIPLKTGNVIWDVSKGAGCNVPEISMNIHCSGTHTESVGHLLENSGDVGSLLMNPFMPAVLITLDTVNFNSCKDTYHCHVGNKEQVISFNKSFMKYKRFFDVKPDVLIIRTRPNPKSKKFTNFSDNRPPFFTNEAMSMICDIKIKHLIVDIPSVDRMSDDGILGNHRIFWGDGYNPNSKLNPESTKTITELAYIPNTVKDGFYFVNIQIPHFVCDAAPSRPLLCKTM